MSDEYDGLIVLLLLGGLLALCCYANRWRGSGTAYGTASWATVRDLRNARMLAGVGLILGRSLEGGRLIRLPTYTHLMVVAPTGAGKGVSLVTPNLLTYAGSCFTWDPKGELTRLTAGTRRALGQQVVVLDPFGITGEPSAGFNPLDLIEEGPRLIDQARALAEAVGGAAKSGSESDPHWIESAVAVIHAMTVYVLLRFRDGERNLNSVCEMVADPALFASAVEQLRGMGGIPGRLGGYLSGLRDKELSSVLSTANRALAGFASELVASMLARSDFDATELLRTQPGMTVYFVLPEDQLQAQRATLRLVVSSFIQLILRCGVEEGGECLFLDECAALGPLDDLEQALVLGRGAGIRLFTFWQSADQARAAFKDKPGLFFDNSGAQVYFGTASYQTAELVSKMLGDATITLEGYSVNESRSRSWQQGGQGEGSTQFTSGSSRNYSEIGRSLLRPEEILALDVDGDYLIAFVRGVRPIFARRLKWFQEPFLTGRKARRALGLWWVLLLAVALVLLAWGWSQN